MEELQKELEETRSAMEKLTEEHRVKSILSDRLRSAHDEQLARLQDAKAEIAKQAREIDQKAEELSLAKQMFEDLKSDLSQKESVMKQLTLVNENLKDGLREKLLSCEVRNKELVLALDEANVKREDQEQVMCSYKKEIEGLKALLLQSQRKCYDAEKRADAPKELSRRNEMLLELEQEKGKIEDQLKWKNEQFRHLEEAHNKVQYEFRRAKRDWELERSNLFDEISTLQMKLDSQTRVTNELRSQLQMCNQALAHEESRRKLLEVKISESKALYENVITEYEEARSKIEALTARRDDEVATLRNSLATKATLLKEMEFSKTCLEMENLEFRKSLKEHQEDQINGVDAAASLKNLRQKFRALEQVHRECSEKLKAREVKWTTHAEKLGKDLNECLAKLISKDKQIWDLQVELEGSYDSLVQQKLENEEISIVHIVLESKLLESCSNLGESKVELEVYTANVEERIKVLMEQVERANTAFIQAQAEVKRERETAESLQTRIQYLESIEHEYFFIQKELITYKGMFEESSRNADCSRQQESQKVNELQEDLKKASDALDQANSALAEKASEICIVEFELQQLKTVVEQMENLRSNLEIELAKYRGKYAGLQRDTEVSFLARTEAEKALVEEKERSFRITEQKDKIIEHLQQQLVRLEKDFTRRDLEATSLGKLATEKDNKLLQIAEVVDKKIKCVSTKLDFLEQKYEEAVVEALMNLEKEKATILSFEQEFTRSVETGAALKLAQKNEFDRVYKALEKILTIHILEEQEIHYGRIMIDEMKEEIDTLQLKLATEEKLSFDLKDHIGRLEADKIMEKLERGREKIKVENELKRLRNNIRASKSQIAQLISEREEFVRQINGLSDLISEAYQKDKDLARNWKTVVTKATHEDDTAMNSEGENLFSYHKSDGSNHISPSRNKTGKNSDRRLLLKEYNF